MNFYCRLKTILNISAKEKPPEGGYRTSSWHETKAIKANDAVLMSLQIIDYPSWITIAWENGVMNPYDDTIIRNECDAL